jgi:hypothetical protein
MAAEWTADQAATMAQVIPIVGLALGLEMRELRKVFDRFPRQPLEGKDSADEVGQRDEAPDDEAPHEATQEAAFAFDISFLGKSIIIALLSCFAMFALLAGEQVAITGVLGGPGYPSGALTLGLRIALTVVFLSPVAQLLMSFVESIFRRLDAKAESRNLARTALLSVMTAVGWAMTIAVR